MHAVLDSSVDSTVERRRLATTEGHVGNGALVGGLASGTELLDRLDGGLLSGIASPCNTGNDITHRTATIGTEHLDSVNLGGLRYTVLATSDGTGAVCAVTVAILVDIVLGNGLAPVRTAFELLVLVVDTSIDDVDINTLATFRLVDVLIESAEPEPIGVRDTSQAPWGPTLSGQVGRRLANSINYLVTLDEVNLGEGTNLIESAVGELASVALELAVVDVGQPGAVSEGIGLKTNASAPESIEENRIRWLARLKASRGANNITK